MSESPLSPRVEAAQTSIRKLQRKLNLSTVLSAIIAIALLGLMAGYFYFGYQGIKDLTEPRTLVALGSQMLEDNVPVVRRTLQDEVKRSAPVWAETLSGQVTASIPTVRESLEDYVLGQTEALVGEMAGMTTQEFREYLQSNRDTMNTVLEELASDQETSEATLADLENGLDQAMQANTKEQANLLLHTLFSLGDRVEKLAIGNGLTEEERLERQALMIIRRLQLQQADPSLVGQPIGVQTSRTVVARTTAPEEASSAKEATTLPSTAEEASAAAEDADEGGEPAE